MAFMAIKQQDTVLVKKCCPDLKRTSSILMTSIIILVVTLILSGILNSIVDCRVIDQQDTSNSIAQQGKHNSIDSNDNNDNNSNIDKETYFAPDMMMPPHNNQNGESVSKRGFASSAGHQQQQRSVPVLGEGANRNDANNLGAILRGPVVSQSSFLDKEDLEAGNDHELPPDYYYYYRLPQKNQQPNFGGSMDFGSRSLSVNNNDRNYYNSNIQQQYPRSKSANTYHDYNTLVYPDNDLRNYDLEKRLHLGTTMSTVESYLPRSAPLRIKLLE